MKFWQKIKEFFKTKNKETKRNVFKSMFPFLFQDYTLENSEIVFAAVSRIANALASMPVAIRLKHKIEFPHYLDKIKIKPNPNQTWFEFIRTLEVNRCTTGDCYALKVFSPSLKLQRLDVVNPAKITPLLHEETNEIWYRMQTDAGEIYIHNYYVIHMKFLSSDGIKGINPISVLTNTLNRMSEIERLSTKQLEKGIDNAIVLEAPGNLGENQRKVMIDSFMKTYQETDGNILLLESGVAAKALNLSAVDSKIFEVERITRSRVAMVYGIPPHLLGDYSNESYSSIEQQQLEFIKWAMLPIVRMYEEEFSTKLLLSNEIKEGYKLSFDMDANLRADAATRAEANFKAVRSAQRTPNENRDDDGKEPLPGGDNLYISKDMIRLDLLETLLKGGDDENAI